MKTISGLPMFCLSLGVPCEHHLRGFVFGDSGSRLNLCFLWCLCWFGTAAFTCCGAEV